MFFGVHCKSAPALRQACHERRARQGQVERSNRAQQSRQLAPLARTPCSCRKDSAAGSNDQAAASPMIMIE